MNIQKIIYLDSTIKVCCEKTTPEEAKKLTSKVVQQACIYYSIGLLDNPESKVIETVKVEKKDIIYTRKYIVLSFPLDGLLKPQESEITLNSIHFIFQDKSKYKVKFSYTQPFCSIESDPSVIENIIKSVRKPTPSATPTKKSTKKQIVKTAPVPGHSGNLDDIKHFIDSYQKFKVQLKESDLQELVDTKQNTVDFNLKSFGISLLCKLLLLIKSVNELVDNEFQKDLHEFLRSQILDRLKTEVTA